MNSQATANRQSDCDGAPPAPDGKKRKSRAWLLVLVLCILGGGAYYLSRGPSQAQQAKSKADAAKMGGRAVPVVTMPARRGDMGIFLDGLGSVLALNTVTIRSRVDGHPDSVAFTG